MAIKASGYFNDPALAQAAANLSALFEPTSGADTAAYATADAKRAEMNRLGWLFDNPNDPSASRRSALTGVQGYGQTPEGFIYNVDQGNATARYGVDRTFDASRLNNADDNARALRDREMQEAGATYRLSVPDVNARYGYDRTFDASRLNNADDNARALEERRLQESGLMERQLMNPIAVNKDQKVFLPSGLAEKVDLAPILEGNRDPLSETQQAAAERQRLIEAGVITDDMLTQDFLGQRTPVQALGADGKPVYMSPGEAVQRGSTPVEKGPQTVVNMGANGVDYGDPGKGLAWARDANGKVQLDERGAPVAIPFQGGEVWQKQQAAEAAAAVKGGQANTKNNIVLQDIDRALNMINESPLLTTGVGSQITSAVGGTPAHNVNAILDTVKANVGFDQLQAMRDASPTGGALGSITEFENRLLQSVLGNLETSQSKDQLEFNLKRLYSVVDEIVNHGVTPEKAGQLNFDGRGGDAAAGAGQTTGTPDGTIIENDAGARMVRRGGKWEPFDGR